MTATLKEERAAPAGPAQGYAPGPEERPLAGYAILIAAFSALLLIALIALRRSGQELPQRPRLRDVLLVGAATHKASRLIGKDKVTSALRAPFAEYQGPGAPGEVEEKPRGRGLRYAVGELITCPYCLSMWVATAFALGLAAAPRATRLAAFILTAVGISDFLQIAYKGAGETA